MKTTTTNRATIINSATITKRQAKAAKLASIAANKETDFTDAEIIETNTNTVKVDIEITNKTAQSKNNTLLPAINKTFWGKDFSQAVGFAIAAANEILRENSQYDKPCVKIGRYMIDAKEVGKFRKAKEIFRADFPIFRAKVLAGHVNLDSASERLNYVNSVKVTEGKETELQTEIQTVAMMAEHFKVLGDMVKMGKIYAKTNAVPDAIAQFRDEQKQARKLALEYRKANALTEGKAK